ncbi:PorT family protein [Arenibacter sp. F26102]|uniref:outer membrane beta-barrel protein n=1 Tax=Arenibacter sp. F26102 TaxID=2926416 RepID=UPI001FF32AA6|nr:outer membrane beta-barrel protein [Arenibacter sp. F26102]MCK0145332.1 PorT family protein [Arenibacter sp. F26102]
MATRILILISIFLFSTPVITAQDVSKKIKLGVSASLEKNVSSKRVAFCEYTGFFADYNKSNYRFGLNLEYLLKGNLTINGSLNYSNKDFTGTYFCDVCDFIFPSNPENVELRLIEVPIALKYYLLPGKVRLFGEVGVSNMFPLNNLQYEATTNSYVIGYKLGSGMEYNVSNKIALQLTVDYYNSISKIFEDSYFAGSGYGLRSVGFGLTILKKI